MKTAMTEITKQVPLEDLIVATFNPRRHGTATGMQELTNSVREHGVIVPLIGRPTGKNGTIEIIAGGRRLKASQEAKLKTVPVTIRELTDTQAREIAIIDNLQREDVHPMEEALAYRDLLDTGGFDTKQVAAKVGKPEDYIYRRLILCGLIEKAQEIFIAGKMNISHAHRVARLEPPYQEQILVLFVDELPTLYTVDRWIGSNVLVVLSNAPFDTKDATLVPKAGSCLKCQKRTGANTRLWQEMTSKDSCLDPECFAGKKAAFLDRTRAKLAKVKNGFLEISHGYGSSSDGKVLGSEKWSDAKKGECLNVKSGLIVDGFRDIGKVIQVCAEPTCKVHHRRAVTTATSSSKSAHDKMLENLLDSNIRSRVLLGVIARFKTLEHADLEQLADHFTHRLGADDQKVLWRLYDWEVPKGTFGRPPDGHLKKTFAEWSVPQLFSYLLAVSLTSEVKLPSYSTKHATYDGPLFEAAKRLKVPVEEIKTYCKAEAAARKLKGNKRSDALAKLKLPDPKVKK